MAEWINSYAAGEAERIALAVANSELRSVVLRSMQAVEQCELLAGELARTAEDERAMADGLARLVLDLLAGRTDADRTALETWGRSRGLLDITSHLTSVRAFTDQEAQPERST